MNTSIIWNLPIHISIHNSSSNNNNKACFPNFGSAIFFLFFHSPPVKNHIFLNLKYLQNWNSIHIKCRSSRDRQKKGNRQDADRQGRGKSSQLGLSFRCIALWHKKHRCCKIVQRPGIQDHQSSNASKMASAQDCSWNAVWFHDEAIVIKLNHFSINYHYRDGCSELCILSMYRK